MAKKLFYKIGEACKKVDVQPYVLRYWETEFELLSPDKSKSGQRVYTEDDLAMIRRIKELLYVEGYTTAGAKNRLRAELEEGKLGAKVASSGGAKNSRKTAAAKKAEAKAPKRGSRSKSGVDQEPPKDSKTVATKPSKGSENERAERLEAGLRVALDQAREILQRLGARG
ncbi:MAG: MerR family transcriptional regulator [Thermoanaerobaculia bacterium]|nr:MerR family transcriptional regulator [Thermoanaerobaculia bacterium]